MGCSPHSKLREIWRRPRSRRTAAMINARAPRAVSTSRVSREIKILKRQFTKQFEFD